MEGHKEWISQPYMNSTLKNQNYPWNQIQSSFLFFFFLNIVQLQTVANLGNY